MQPKDNFNAKSRSIDDMIKRMDAERARVRTPEEVEQDRLLMDKIRKAREADPNWEKAMREWAEAEAKYGKADPTEGKAVIQRVKKSPKRSK